MSSPQTPNVSSSTMTEITPGSAAPARSNDGLTMYERAKIQIAERERKLKALQEKLMEDYTFTPQSTANSASSSIASSPEKVFDRLYNTETAAMRARRVSPRSTLNSPFATPARNRVRSNKDGYITPGRLEELHEEGQNRLRAKNRTQQEEDDERRKRMEEEELAKCTFTPQTKWRLAAERRRKGREEEQRAAEEARFRSPRPKLSEREQWQKIHDEEELKKCTFKPNLKWNIAKERREMAGISPTLWDDDDDDALPLHVTRTPLATTKASNNPISPLSEPRVPPKLTPVEHSTPPLDTHEKSGYTTNIKLVSADNFQEDSGKVTKAPTVVRSNYVGAVVPPSPEWKQKYKKIGPKQSEKVFETKGSAEVETMQVRSNFSSTIVAGGNKTFTGKISPQKPLKMLEAKDAELLDIILDVPLIPEITRQAPAMKTAELPSVSPTEPVKNVETEDAPKLETNVDATMIRDNMALPLMKKTELPVVSPQEPVKNVDTKEKLETIVDASIIPKIIEQVAPTPTPPPEKPLLEVKPNLSIEVTKSWLGGLLQKKGIHDDSDALTPTHAQHAPRENDLDAILSSAEAAAGTQADALSRKLAEEEALAKKDDTNENQDKADKKKNKVNTWKQRLLGKRSKSKDESTSGDEDTDAKKEELDRLKRQEAAIKEAEKDALRKADEALMKSKEEARISAEQEARRKAEMEERLKAQEEAKLKAEQEERRKALEVEARLKAEEEARRKAEEEARLKALEVEARLKAEQEAREKAEQVAKLRAEEEDRLRAEQEALVKAEEDRLRAEQEARLKEEAQFAFEVAAKKAEEDAARQFAVAAALEDAIEAKQNNAGFESLQLEDAAITAGELKVAQIKKDALDLAIAGAEYLKSQDEAYQQSEESAVDVASSDDDGGVFSTDDDEVLVGDPKKSDRAKKWKERLAKKGKKDASKDGEKQVAVLEQSFDLVEVQLDSPAKIVATRLESDPGKVQSDDEDFGTELDDEVKKKKSDRANKWKERLTKRTKGTKSKSKSSSKDQKSDAATAGIESSEKVAYPRVLLNEGEESKIEKEPEIGSI